MTDHRYTVVFEPAEDGGYTTYVPALPGCVSEGDTLDEARAMIREAIELYLESLRDDGIPAPKETHTSGTHPFVDQIAVAS